LSVRQNIQKKLAGVLKELTHKHRTLQKTYAEKINPNSFQDKDLDNPPSLGLFDEKEYSFHDASKFREEGISLLVANLHELALIFKELNSLVVDQGTLLDRIDYNLSADKENTHEAVKQLSKAARNQQCSRATSCLLFLIVLIAGLVLLLIFKHS
jgi:syntaxin 16